jgi:two-component system response regulator DevR
VFLLDSHEIFRKGVRSVLDERDEVEVVGESSSFPDGVEEIAAARPHVAVVGIRENELSELGRLRALQQAHPDVRVLVLTRTDNDDALAAAMRVGANGYLSKDVPAHQLVTAVHSIAGGHDVIDPVRAMRLMSRQRSGEGAEGSNDPLASLTSQERKILDLLAEGLTNRQIAERLFLVEKTVRNHVTRVLAKLGVERRTQAALMVARLADRVSVPNQTSHS